MVWLGGVALGSVLLGPTGDGEWLAYSIAWLAFALGDPLAASPDGRP